MSIRRVTIMLDDKLIKKLRDRQAKMIQKNNQGISFSKVLNLYVKSGLANERKRKMKE